VRSACIIKNLHTYLLVVHLLCLLFIKVKVGTYSLPNVRPGADPRVQAVRHIHKDINLIMMCSVEKVWAQSDDLSEHAWGAEQYHSYVSFLLLLVLIYIIIIIITKSHKISRAAVTYLTETVKYTNKWNNNDNNYHHYLS